MINHIKIFNLSRKDGVNMKSIISLDDGKYTIVENLLEGEFECLRYGEKWRDLSGNNMVLSMFYRIKELESGLIQVYEEILNGNRDLDRILEISDELTS